MLSQVAQGTQTRHDKCNYTRREEELCKWGQIKKDPME